VRVYGLGMRMEGLGGQLPRTLVLVTRSHVHRLCHEKKESSCTEFVIHTMSHHHTYYVTSSSPKESSCTEFVHREFAHREADARERKVLYQRQREGGGGMLGWGRVGGGGGPGARVHTRREIRGRGPDLWVRVWGLGFEG